MLIVDSNLQHYSNREQIMKMLISLFSFHFLTPSYLMYQLLSVTRLSPSKLTDCYEIQSPSE
jgi:hypothetical protein